MLVGVFVCAICSRDRGCSVHPAFPAPSDQEGKAVFWQTSGRAACEIAKHVCCLKFESAVVSPRPVYARASPGL
jgi:hypothetical protein